LLPFATGGTHRKLPGTLFLLPQALLLRKEMPLTIQPNAEISSESTDVAPSTPFAFLPENLREVLARQGIEQPTPIQEKAIPVALEGRDVLAQSHTGSGKTLAFGLSLALRLNQNPRKDHSRGVRALVLTPTRELADQVVRALEGILKACQLSSMAITGGASYTKQKQALNRGIDVVVGTPGRICDLMNQELLKMSSVEVFVLDEVDEMLDIGFSEDLKKIREAVGENAQALFFSATLNGKIRSLARSLLRDPVEVAMRRVDTDTASSIRHGYVEVAAGGEFKALINTFLFHAPEQALVFCETKAECAQLVEGLVTRGLNAAALHGDLSQQERNTTMAKFREKKLQFLVATNVAARGIDVQGLPLVVNFSTPYDLESYTHRTGRTGRAGAEGKAWTLVTPRTARNFEFLMGRLRLQPERIAIPAYAEIIKQAADLALAEAVGQQAQESAGEAEKAEKAAKEKSLTLNQKESNKTIQKAVGRALEGLDSEQKDVLLQSLLKKHLEKSEGFYLSDVEPVRKLVRLDPSERSFERSDRKPFSSREGGSREGSSRDFRGERKPFEGRGGFGKGAPRSFGGGFSGGSKERRGGAAAAPRPEDSLVWQPKVANVLLHPTIPPRPDTTIPEVTNSPENKFYPFTKVTQNFWS
jgi:ATP-dependent RNA helicase DeaD